MKNISYVLMVVIFLLSGCNKSDSISSDLLDEVERLVDTNPDSAYSLLAMMSQTYDLNEKNLAKWCLLYSTISKKISIAILPTEQMERAAAWYNENGRLEERLQIGLFLGESYVKAGDMQKAMIIYTEICHEAKQKSEYNILGYAHSYMGDLYELQNYISQSVDNYRLASSYFVKANNMRSHACALRDLGRQYVFMDSVTIALNLIERADSIALAINDKEVRSSTLNALGNVCLIKEEFNKAEMFFLKALSITKDSLPNYFALIDLYVQLDSVQKAKVLLQKLPHDNPRCLHSVKEAYYHIYKKEGDYWQALQCLEECTSINDSLILADNEAEVLELEKRYNHLKIQKESVELKLSQQKYQIIVVLCLVIILSVLLIGFWYKREAENKIYMQQSELKEIKSRLLQLSSEAKRRKELLDLSKDEIEKSRKIQREIEILSAKYKNLRVHLLVNSGIYKKLRQLIKQNVPRNDKPLITEEYWCLITEQIVAIYPGLKCFLLEYCPNMTDQEWRYCCLYMFGFDGKEEAKLLNLLPNSVLVKRSRFRQKLKIAPFHKANLYEYIANNVY